MARTAYFTREQAKALTDKVLAFSGADEVRVNLQSGIQGNTRWAANQISTAADVRNAAVVVTSAFGKRVASATTNRFEDEALRQAVQTSERLARLVPEDPEYLGELGAQESAEVESFFESTALLNPEARARAVAQIAGPARARNLVSTGFVSFQAGSQAVGTRRGLFAYTPTTLVNLSTTVRTPDGTGSGWAGAGAHDWNRINPAQLGQTAIRKAELARNPRRVEPGEWTVILEPTAVANMLTLLVAQLSARQADEGRSFFSRPGEGNRINERLFDPRVTLYSDPGEANLYNTPFNDEGLPNRRMVWVENGVLRNLIYDRFWAQQSNRSPTGFPSGFAMSGGESSVDEMIASTERGLLVTRFWYIRAVDPRTVLYTGLTRDGTFLIEKGRIVSAVKNLRWNESPAFILNAIEQIGRPVRVSASESGDVGFAVSVPPLRVRGFTFSSVSDAI